MLLTTLPTYSTDPIEMECNLSLLTGDVPCVIAVETANSVYTVTVHGMTADGYQRASVIAPAHAITGASPALLTGVTCRVLGNRLVVVDTDDIRRTVLRTSDIVAIHLVAMFEC